MKKTTFLVLRKSLSQLSMLFALFLAVTVPTKVLASSEAIVQNVNSDWIRRNLTEEQKIREEHEKMCKTWARKLVTQYFINRENRENREIEIERLDWESQCANPYNRYYENTDLIPPRPRDLNGIY